MAELRPFAAWRYDPAVVGEMSDVVAPPYDVIDDAHRDVLYARSPYNVVRLILGREQDRYAAAAEALGNWRNRGVLVRDPRPALYVYVQEFRLDGRPMRRSGIIGAVRLEPFSSGRIRPHEKTLAGPKADRLRLMDATRTNLSPIFALYAGASPAVETAQRSAVSGTPLNDLTDEFGVRHRLWAISEAAAFASVGADLGPRTFYIADGHHRYETALAYRDKLAAGGRLGPDHPANFIMMFLCSMADPGLVILPTHRLLSSLPGFEAARFLAALRAAFTLETFPISAAAGLQRAMERAGGHSCFGLAVRGAESLFLAKLADPDVMARLAPGLSAAVRQLDVSLLDVVVLQQALGVDAHDAAHDGRLRYVKEADEALAAVRGGNADVACLLNATRMSEIEAVCDAGDTMPEKSTYFHPKLGSGFAFHALEPQEDVS